MNKWDRQQKFMFFGIIAFAIVCMSLTIVLMLTNPEANLNNEVLDNRIEAAAIYQYAFQSIAEKNGEFSKETFVDDVNRHVHAQHVIVVENDLTLSSFMDQYGEKYIFQYVSNEHIRLLSKGKDKEINTDDDIFIDYLVYKQDDVLVYEMRTAKLIECNHDYYDFNNEATCTKTGTTQHRCRKCGNAIIQWYPVSAHTFENNICTACGETEIVEEGE
jgi:hypothetical protein